MSSTPQSNKRYWLLNRQRLLRERRERYLVDKAYREAAKARSKKVVILKKVQRKVNPPAVYHDGVYERSYTPSQLAKKCNRSVDSMFLWRIKGVIPPALHKQKQWDRYAESQALYVRDITEQINSGRHMSILQIRGLLNNVWGKKYKPGIITTEVCTWQRRKSSGRRSSASSPPSPPISRTEPASSRKGRSKRSAESRPS